MIWPEEELGPLSSQQLSPFETAASPTGLAVGE